MSGVTPTKPRADDVYVGVRLRTVLLLIALATAVLGVCGGAGLLVLSASLDAARDEDARGRAALAARIDELTARIAQLSEERSGANISTIRARASEHEFGAPFDQGRHLLVVHGGWKSGVASVGAPTVDPAHGCTGELLNDELAAIKSALPNLEVVDEQKLVALGDSIDDYGVVLHHNGGWARALPAGVAQALLRAAARHPLVFLGDDVGLMVEPDAALRHLLGINGVANNGSYPTSLRYGNRGIDYAKEPDQLTLDARTTTLARTRSTPVAWTLHDASARFGVGVLNLSLLASDVCPVSNDTLGLGLLFRDVLRDVVSEVSAPKTPEQIAAELGAALRSCVGSSRVRSIDDRGALLLPNLAVYKATLRFTLDERGRAVRAQIDGSLPPDVDRARAAACIDAALEGVRADPQHDTRLVEIPLLSQ